MRYPEPEAATFKASEVLADRAYGAMLGLAIGDALGAPLEFSRRDSLPVVSELIGGGPFGLRAGEWTDDMSMALCLADSLIANGGLNDHDLLDRFLRWWKEGENSVTGRCFDIGNATRFALERYQRLRSPAGSGPREARHAGNGSIMRLAPAAIFAAPDEELARALAAGQSEATHANDQTCAASELLATLLVEAMSGRPKEEVLASRLTFGTVETMDIAAGTWVGKSRDEIHSSGYVLDTLEAALWCVQRTSTFEEALILAVNLGDDSDTVGAVTGQLAGALYGRSAIPERWLQKLAWREHIEERVSALLQAGSAARARAK